MTDPFDTVKDALAAHGYDGSPWCIEALAALASIEGRLREAEWNRKIQQTFGEEQWELRQAAERERDNAVYERDLHVAAALASGKDKP